MHNFFSLFCILHFALCIWACSVPNLEIAQCAEARDSVKQFYSWYIGTDAETKSQQPEIYRKFVSAEFPIDPEKWELDPYLLTNNLPKSFRVAECNTQSSEKTNFNVILLWHDGSRSEQKKILVETLKNNGSWLINKVSN